MKKNTYYSVFLTLSILLTSCSGNHRLNCNGEEGAMQEGFDNYNEEEVLAAINRGADVNASCQTHLPPLHRAVQQNLLKVTTALLDMGVSVDSRDKYGSTPLHWASLNRHTQPTQLLLDRGATVDSQDDLGDTPLHWAAEWGRTQVAQLLLKRGAKVDRQGNCGYSPLHTAVIYGSTQVAQLLLKQGAKVDIQDKRKDTPLMRAIDSYGARGKVDLFKLLIDQRQDFYLTNNQGKTALEIAQEQFKVAEPAHKKFYSMVIAMIQKKMRDQ